MTQRQLLLCFQAVHRHNEHLQVFLLLLHHLRCIHLPLHQYLFVFLIQSTNELQLLAQYPIQIVNETILRPRMT